MKARDQSIAIIGAGVSGLTSGVVLAEAGYRACLFAEEIGPGTTSAAAAAIWFPYDAGPAQKVIAWSLETFEVLAELSRDPTTGVSMIELRQFCRAGALEIPTWALSLGAHPLSADSIPKSFTSGFALEVPLLDTTRYLDYLAARFGAAGGEIQEGVRFDRLEEVSPEWQLLVNCAGVGARGLVPDPAVEPHRGQVVMVPRIADRHATVCDEPPLMYAIPRTNDCVFGGTNEPSSVREADPAQTGQIVTECSRVLGIEPPPILGQRVGLRPFRRGGVCLCAALLAGGRRVIHNYGHGGSGFTLSWGCARAVLALAYAR
jgi:D-amino-acid oxidase